MRQMSYRTRVLLVKSYHKNEIPFDRPLQVGRVKQNLIGKLSYVPGRYLFYMKRNCVQFVLLRMIHERGRDGGGGGVADWSFPTSNSSIGGRGRRYSMWNRGGEKENCIQVPYRVLTTTFQCPWSVGSVSFGLPRLWIIILPPSSKNSEKTLDFYCCVTSLWLFCLRSEE